MYIITRDCRFVVQKFAHAFTLGGSEVIGCGLLPAAKPHGDFQQQSTPIVNSRNATHNHVCGITVTPLISSNRPQQIVKVLLKAMAKYDKKKRNINEYSRSRHVLKID